MKHLSEQPGDLCCICLKVHIWYSLFRRIPFPSWPLSRIFTSTLLSRAKVGEPQPRAGEKNGARKKCTPLSSSRLRRLHGVSIQIFITLGKKISPHILRKKNCCDLNLGESLCIFTLFLFQIVDFIY